MDNGFPADYTLYSSYSAGIVVAFFVFRRQWGIFMGVLTIIIDIARVTAVVHYPIDIVGSIGIAVLTTCISWITLKTSVRRQALCIWSNSLRIKMVK
jgi:membrane-associated phospholipid phosphatase